MTVDLVALCLDAHDPRLLARFWAGVLGWEPLDETTLVPDDDTGFRLRFRPTDEPTTRPKTRPKTRPNQMHLDLTSTSLAQQQETVARALALGGRHHDVGQLPDEEHVVLADPEGNEFCVIEPGNGFLAECGFVGALASDGTRELGYFWSKALGWPLVWDQDEETAIRAPYGGPKVTWGGPPVAPKLGRNRLHFDLAPTEGADHGAALERLVSLGAKHRGPSSCGADAAELLDPDGNELCLLTSSAR